MKKRWIAPIGALSILTPLVVTACAKDDTSDKGNTENGDHNNGIKGHNNPSVFKKLDSSFDIEHSSIKGTLVHAKIKSWIDGDTPIIHPDDNSGDFNLRVASIDTPETHTRGHDGKWVDTSGEEREWGLKATEFARKTIPDGTSILISLSQGSSYNRKVGSIFYKKNPTDKLWKNYSVSILYNGFALPFVSTASKVLTSSDPLSIIGHSLADSYNYAYEKKIGVFDHLHVLEEHGVTSDLAVRYRTTKTRMDAPNIYDYLGIDYYKGDK